MIKNIDDIESDVCKKLQVVFFDIDDTITLQGKLLRDSYNALWRCKENGLRLVPITGRPAGWVDHIARMWPVDAVIGENGAFYFWMENNKMHHYFVQDEKTRQQNRIALTKISDKILTQVPQARIAADQKYREIDLAIDFCEDIEHIGEDNVRKIVNIFSEEGAQAKVSSIHVNGWFGEFDKMTTCKKLITELWHENFESNMNTYIYCGDSPNDEPMFTAFSHSVGVANVKKWLPEMKEHPSYITSLPGGEGFSEFIDILLRKRNNE